MSEIELNPCPFCGGSAMLSRESGDERVAYQARAWVACLPCGARGQSAYGDTSKGGYADNTGVELRAAAGWNTRAALTPPDGYVPERDMLYVATLLRRRAAAASPMARNAYIKSAEEVEMAVIAARPEPS